MNYYDLFDKVLKKLNGMNGKSITFTKANVHPTDNFILLGYGYDECAITFKKRYDGVWVILFSNDNPILLENCPQCFLETLLLNL